MGNSNAKPVEKEIIIKCSPEAMMKAFFKDYVIVWHDPNVNSQENQRFMALLEKFCKVESFEEWHKAKDYIQTTHDVCHVITSGTNGELLIKEIFENEKVCKIYIFCGNKEFHSRWAQNYKNVSCIETDLEAVLYQIQQNLLEWFKQTSSFNLNLPTFAPIFNESDKSEMNHLHHHLKAISNFNDREQAKNDFLLLSEKFIQDPKDAIPLRDFRKTYNEFNKDQILRWYTKESLLHKVTNNSLRIATSDSIQYCRLVLQDIERAIKEQYQTKSKNFNGLVYRGCYLSDEEWSSLKENTGREIEMHGFLSVSKVKNVALDFMRRDPSKMALITIIVPKGPNEEEQGFAEIEECSQFSYEEEVLFNVRSRFTILETEEELPNRHLVLLYGAQGFRKFVTERSPIQEITVPNVESVSCAHCKVKAGEMPQKLLFLSLTDPNKHLYYCKKCTEHGVGPFLLIPARRKAADTIKMSGCLLMNSGQNQTPFYGYQCCQCQAKKQKHYFTCTDCDGKEKKWCENCFEDPLSCINAEHNIILETNPFSFWCEKMSRNELNHLKFQNDLIKKDNYIFKQAEMYVETQEYEKAIEYYDQYIQENKSENKDSNLATAYNNIGRVYFKLGEEITARRYYLESLKIRISLSGDNHPDIATSYDDLGQVSFNQGAYKEARNYFLKSLDSKKSVVIENHSDVAVSYNNIGLVDYCQGEYDTALEYHLKSLDIRKSLYEDSHPDLAISYSNIGLICTSQEEYKEALEYHQKSLDIRILLYGDNNLHVATSYNNFGLAYYNQGEYQKAIEYHQKSLDIRKSVFGENHVDVADSYNNFGNVHYNQREYQKALSYYFKCLEIRKLVHGGHHINVANSYNNIGLVYESQEEYEMAIECHLKCLEIRKFISEENHADIGNFNGNLGDVYAIQKDYKTAIEYHLKCLNIRKSLERVNQDAVTDYRNKIRDAHTNQVENRRAIEIYSKCLDIRKSLERVNQDTVADSCNKIGDAHANLGDYKTAIEYHLKCLNIRKSLYGNNHADVADSYNSIGLVYFNQKEYEMAIKYYRKCLDIRQSLYGETHRDVVDVYLNIQNVLLALESRLSCHEIRKLGNHPDNIKAFNAILEIESIIQNKQRH